MPLPGGQVLVGAACLLFVVVAFGSAAPCFKVVDVPPLVRTSWRIQASTLLYVVVFAPAAWALAGSEGRAAFRAPGVGWRVAVCGALFLASFVCWNWSIANTSFVHATVLGQLSPWFVVVGEAALFVAFRGSPGLRQLLEHAGVRRPASAPSLGEVAGAALAVAGVAVASVLGTRGHPEEGGGLTTPVSLAGDAVALLNAGLYTAYMVWTKWQLPKAPPILIMGGAHALMTPVTWLLFPLASPGMAMVGTRDAPGLLDWPTSEFLWPCLALIAVAAATGHAAVLGAVQRLPPLVCSVALLALPLPQAVVGYEIGVAALPGWASAVGCAVTLSGICLVVVASGRRKKRDEDASVGHMKRAASGRFQQVGGLIVGGGEAELVAMDNLEADFEIDKAMVAVSDYYGGDGQESSDEEDSEGARLLAR